MLTLQYMVLNLTICTVLHLISVNLININQNSIYNIKSDHPVKLYGTNESH